MQKVTKVSPASAHVQLPQLLTISDVAKILGVSRPTVYVLIDDGLPVIRFGRSIRISSLSLQQWLKEHERAC